MAYDKQQKLQLENVVLVLRNRQLYIRDCMGETMGTFLEKMNSFIGISCTNFDQVMSSFISRLERQQGTKIREDLIQFLNIVESLNKECHKALSTDLPDLENKYDNLQQSAEVTWIFKDSYKQQLDISNIRTDQSISSSLSSLTNMFTSPVQESNFEPTYHHDSPPPTDNDDEEKETLREDLDSIRDRHDSLHDAKKDLQRSASRDEETISKMESRMRKLENDRHSKCAKINELSNLLEQEKKKTAQQGLLIQRYEEEIKKLKAELEKVKLESKKH